MGKIIKTRHEVYNGEVDANGVLDTDVIHSETSADVVDGLDDFISSSSLAGKVAEAHFVSVLLITDCILQANSPFIVQLAQYSLAASNIVAVYGFSVKVGSRTQLDLSVIINPPDTLLIVSTTAVPDASVFILHFQSNIIER